VLDNSPDKQNLSLPSMLVSSRWGPCAKTTCKGCNYYSRNI